MPLIADLAVAGLAAGATVVVPHGLTGGSLNAAIAPTWVLPDRATPIRCSAADVTNCTFINDGIVAASATFRAWHIHSIDAQDALVAQLWNGGAGSGGSGGAGDVAQIGSAGAVAFTDDAGAVETVISTIALPIGSMNSVGRVLRFFAAGHVVGSDVNTATYRVRIGGLAGTLLAELAASVPSGANANWFVDFKSRVLVAGAAGTLTSSGIQRTHAAAAVVEVNSVSAGLGPLPLDIAQNLVFTVAFSAAAAQTGLLDTFVADIGGV